MAELVAFYYEEFKPLYSSVQQTNSVPMEMMFEINAAFDHWTRILHYGEPEEKVIGSVCAHLKRGCFDVFKIIVSQTRSKFDELKQTDLSLIDNGEFVRSLNRLWSEISEGASDARMSEGDSRDEERWHLAFDKWEAVIEKCAILEKEFYHSSKVTWARDKEREAVKIARRNSWFQGVATGVIATAVVGVATALFGWLPRIHSFFAPWLGKIWSYFGVVNP